MRNYTKITIKSIKQSLVRYTHSLLVSTAFCKLYAVLEAFICIKKSRYDKFINNPGKIHIITIRNSNKENPLVQDIVEILWETKNNNEKMQIWETSFGKTTAISGNANATENTIATSYIQLSIKQLDLLGRLRSDEKRKIKVAVKLCADKHRKATNIHLLRCFIFFIIVEELWIMNCWKPDKLTREPIITLCDIFEIQRAWSWEPLLRVFAKTFHSNKIIDRDIIFHYFICIYIFTYRVSQYWREWSYMRKYAVDCVRLRLRFRGNRLWISSQ